jgi:hypothetical protein
VLTLLRRSVLYVVLLLTITSAAWAADQTVTLSLGAGSALTLERAFKTVLVGDPNIVNVHTHGDRWVILEPLHPGATNLVFVDDESTTIANIRIVVSGASAIPINYQGSKAFGGSPTDVILRNWDPEPCVTNSATADAAE